MYREERQKAILFRLANKGNSSLGDLGRELGVSPATLRRDLGEMAGRGLLQRTRGGAIAASRALTQISFEERSEKMAAEKERIAEAAAGLVKPGQSIFLDSGTTTYRMVRHLAKIRDLFIVTNSIKVALDLAGSSFGNYVLIGGYINREGMSLIGSTAIEQIERYRLDIAFVAVNGLTAETGISATLPEEAQVKRRIISIARKSVVVTDSSKIGVNATAVIAPISAVDILLTDSGADPAILEALKGKLDMHAV